MPYLDESDRLHALYQGLSAVARDSFAARYLILPYNDTLQSIKLRAIGKAREISDRPHPQNLLIEVL